MNNVNQVSEVIRSDKLDQLVAYHFHSSVESVELIDNWLPKLTIENQPNPIVLRIWKHDDPDHYLYHALRNEVAFVTYCNNIGFPNLPKILDYNFSRNLIPWDYYFYEYVHGTPMTDLIPRLDAEEKTTLYHNLGKVVGSLHSTRFDQLTTITLDSDGELAVEPRQWEFRQESDWIRHHFDQIYELFTKYPCLEEYLPQCENLFDKYGEFRKLPPMSVSLTHNDLSSDNIIIRGRGEHPSDFVLIDLTFADTQRVSLDLGRAERRFTTWKTLLRLEEIEHYSKIFFDGYTRVRPLPPEWHGERAIFHLIQLIDDIGFCFDVSTEKDWFLAHQEDILSYTEWELNRLFDQYL